MPAGRLRWLAEDPRLRAVRIGAVGWQVAAAVRLVPGRVIGQVDRAVVLALQDSDPGERVIQVAAQLLELGAPLADRALQALVLALKVECRWCFSA